MVVAAKFSFLYVLDSVAYISAAVLISELLINVAAGVSKTYHIFDYFSRIVVDKLSHMH
jgi:hypothetical protein